MLACQYGNVVIVKMLFAFYEKNGSKNLKIETSSKANNSNTKNDNASAKTNTNENLQKNITPVQENSKKIAWVNEMHHGLTPLWEAVGMGHTEVVRVLLEKSADVTFEFNNRSCLFEAVRKNNTEIVKVLIEYGADPNVGYQGQNWALHEAIRKNNTDMTMILLKSGASVWAMDKDDNVALHLAAATGNDKIVRLVIQSMFNIKNKKKERPVDLLPKKGDEITDGIKKLLLGDLSIVDENKVG